MDRKEHNRVGRRGERRELQKKKERDVQMCTGSNDRLMSNSALYPTDAVTTATVHNNHTRAGETCLPTGDLEEPQQPLKMSPSNREVIAQDNLNKDGDTRES